MLFSIYFCFPVNNRSFLAHRENWNESLGWGAAVARQAFKALGARG